MAFRYCRNLITTLRDSRFWYKTIHDDYTSTEVTYIFAFSFPPC